MYAKYLAALAKLIRDCFEMALIVLAVVILSLLFLMKKSTDVSEKVKENNNAEMQERENDAKD